MKPKKNSEPLSGNGDSIITTETTKNVSERECDGISKWSDPEFVRQYMAEYRKKYKRKAQEYHREYGKTHRDELKQYRQKYHAENKERIHTQKRGYYQENKTRIKRKNDRNKPLRKLYNKCYYEQNKASIMAAACVRTKHRYHTDFLFKVKHLLRTRLRDVCKRKNLIKPKTMTLLGCDLKFFKSYIEAQFKPGMTWDNHGKWGWHIDHIMPLETAKTIKDMKPLCHYKNLQPLWWYDNLSKSGTIPLKQESIINI